MYCPVEARPHEPEGTAPASDSDVRSKVVHEPVELNPAPDVVSKRATTLVRIEPVVNGTK